MHSLLLLCYTLVSGEADRWTHFRVDSNMQWLLLSLPFVPLALAFSSPRVSSRMPGYVRSLR